MRIDQLVTVVLALASWWLTGALCDAIVCQKKRDMRTQYLIEAYRRLKPERALNTQSAATSLESAVADVQLFGSSEQITLAAKFTHRFANHRDASTKELVQSLQDDLRKEQDLGPAHNPITHLRFNVGEPPAK